MKSKRGTEGNLKEVDAVCQLGNAIGVCAEMYWMHFLIVSMSNRLYCANTSTVATDYFEMNK